MANVCERRKHLLLIMLVYRKLSRKKARLFMLFSTLHYLRMKAIQNQGMQFCLHFLYIYAVLRYDTKFL